MVFINQKKKLQKISYDLGLNSNRKSKQEKTNTVLEEEYKRTISSIQLFKQEIDLSIDWENMEQGPTHEPTGINLYKVWSYEINNVPEKWIPFINAEILYRNQTSNDSLIIKFPYKNIFFEIEDIVGSIRKKVTVHASLYFFENFNSPGLQGLYQAKLRLTLRNPNNFI